MENDGQWVRGTEPPRDRLSRLSRANLRINQRAAVDTALQAVLEGACSPTRAPYSVITTLGASGGVEGYLALGLYSGDQVLAALTLAKSWPAGLETLADGDWTCCWDIN